MEIITSNPALMVDPPSLTRLEVDPYTLEEARALLEAAGCHRLEARWLLALMLGLRQGEVLGLGWQHIDFDKRVVSVQRGLQRSADGSLVFVDPKTSRSRRVVPMPPAVAASLARRRAQQQDERRAARQLWHDSDLVFTTAKERLSPRNDYRSFQALLSTAGLRRVRLHDLRHTTASLLLAQGVAPRVAMEILGHSQIGITMNTYTHVAPELHRSATDGVEEALWGVE